MMKKQPKRNRLAGTQEKVASFAAAAFFMLPASALAQFNIADGDVYGSSNVVLTANPITSIKSGISNLDVGYAGTDTINLNDAVSGYISISNGFDGFSIDSSLLGSLTGTNSFGLEVSGGTNLSIAGGTFNGGGALFTNDLRSGVGGILSGVQTALVSNARFEGGRVYLYDTTTGLPPLPGRTNGFETGSAPINYGADAMVVTGSTNITFTSNPEFQGGAGGEADGTGQDAYAYGGAGLVLLDSTAVVSNGTFKGGAGGIANAAGRTAYAEGGHGLYASNSVVEIHGGTFQGASGGTANGQDADGGNGLYLVSGSSAVVSNGTFVGVGENAAAVAVRNSSLTTHGGTFTSGGLYSETIGSETNTLHLNAGAFSTLYLTGSGTNGLHYIESGSNLTVSVGLVLGGGNAVISNSTSSAFQQLTVLDGTLAFSNDLTLASGGLLTLSNQTSEAFFQNLILQAGATADIGQSQLEAYGTLDIETGALLKFKIVTNSWGTATANTVSFGSNSTIRVDATLAGFSTGTNNVALLTSIGGITGDFSNGVVTEVQTTLDTNIAGRTSFDQAAIVGNDVVFRFTTSSLTDYWNATGQLADLADELETIDNSVMNAIINNMGSTASAAAVNEAYFTSLNTFQVAMQGMQAAVGQQVSRGTEFRELLNLPKGAKGPDAPANDWRFWGKYYGQFYTHDAAAQNSAYDATLNGGVVGFDKSFGNLLLGLSGGMGRYKIDADNSASEDLDAAHGSIYSTYGKGHSYIDAGLAYGWNGVESETASPFTMNGDYDAQLVMGYLGGGLGFGLDKISTVVTPEAGVQYTLYNQEAYTETSSVAVPRSFDAFDADSLRTSLGLNVAMLNTKAFKTFAFKVEGRGHWLHEFNPEPGNLEFQLEGGTGNTYTLTYPMLDEDALRLGVGFSFFNVGKKKPRNILLRLDLDGLFGDSFSAVNLGAKAIYAF